MTTERKPAYTGNYPIRWDDIDMYGHVDHSVYFMYMVEVRWKWFYSLNLSKEVKPITPIISASISYKKPLVYPGEVMIKLYGTPPKEKTWIIEHEIFQARNPNELCAKAAVEFIYVDHKTKRPVPIPDEMRKHIYPIA